METKQIYTFRDKENKVISSIYDYQVGDHLNGMMNFFNPDLPPSSKPEVIEFKNGKPDYETYNCYLPIKEIDDEPSEKFKKEIEDMIKVIENMDNIEVEDK